MEQKSIWFSTKHCTSSHTQKESIRKTCPMALNVVLAQKDVLVEKWERQMQADDLLAVTGTVFRWRKDLMKEE